MKAHQGHRHRFLPLAPALSIIAILLFTFPLRSSVSSVVNNEDAWERVLSAAGLTKETCRFDFPDMANWGGDEFLLPYFHAMHADPLRIPFYARIMRQNALAAAPNAGDLVMLGGARINEGTRITLLGDPLAEDARRSAGPGALAAAIESAHAAGGSPLNAAQAARLKAAVQPVPMDVAQNAALILSVEMQAIKWRNRALAKLAGHNPGQVFNKLLGVYPDSDQTPDVKIDNLMHSMDLKYLLLGGEELALAADRAVTALAKRGGGERFAFDWDTPLGRIALHGAQDDTYPGDRPYLLIMDTGGKDTYYGGGATHDADHPASVLIDLAGDDRYLEKPDLANTSVAQYPGRKTQSPSRPHAPSPHPSFGAGVLGYGILIDAAGNDLYRSLNNTQGRGLFGVGILQDRAGNDRYDCYTLGQGSASFGVGILADLGGSDEYRCYTTSQGFGDTKGFGMLADAGTSDDIYEANDTVIDFPSAQTKEHNTSLAQGAGFGRRADYLDGHSLAGGVGILVDGGGKNSFTCGVFGQGTGYWYGVGMLLTGTGEDTYRGIWYAQGAAAHFAVGVLDDEGGNDDYKATMNMAQGAGHDFSIGFLMDEAGNDRYEAPNLSLGAGNANGFGFFWDRSGDDTYGVRPSTTLGRASIEASGRNSIRERDPTLGIFLDTGGRDTYPAELPWAKNDALWTMKDSGAPPLSVMRGAGLDTEAPGTPEPR
jgi:hypothetical protein